MIRLGTRGFDSHPLRRFRAAFIFVTHFQTETLPKHPVCRRSTGKGISDSCILPVSGEQPLSAADAGAHFCSPGRQFRITFREDVSCDLSLIIRNRFPSGVISQLTGPVRIPVSTMSVLNRACGMPAWKNGAVLTGTAIMVPSGE